MDAYRQRRERSQKHPVHDFLFEYYQFNRRLVYHWHPSLNDRLEGEDAHKFLTDPKFSALSNTVFLDPTKLSESEFRRIEWITHLIDAALRRPERTNCYGLHEWAMVYRSNGIRHEDTPLRLDKAQIDSLIKSSYICCTHYDAFRFFTEEARPLNTLQPTADERVKNEQFGCIHFNMDLFKWCYKIHPWVSSELTLDCFFLAVEARELDMQASPYDLASLGYDPIRIETSEGKLDYQSRQKKIAARGRALATRFLSECREIKNKSSFSWDHE